MIFAAKPIEVTTEDRMRVQLVHAWPDRYWQHELQLPANASVADALVAAQDELRGAGIDAQSLGLAVFGRGVDSQTALRDGDRLELLRPLQLSPQQARAARAAAARRSQRKQK